MAVANNERTLMTAIIPPASTHIYSLHSILIKNNIQELVEFSAFTSSIIADFIIRISGRTNILASDLKTLPKIFSPWILPVLHRGLRLNALTSHYKELWVAISPAEIIREQWASESEILQKSVAAWNSQESEAGTQDTNTFTHPIKTYPYEVPWSALAPHKWSWHSPLRSDYARRQALLEIDVLVSLALGLTLDELQLIYRAQFPVMRQYEIADEYDAHGILIPSTNRKAAGGKEVRAARKDWDDESPQTVSWQIDDGNQTVTKTFYPPFTRIDREADYEYAYNFFKAKYGIKELGILNT